MHTLPGKTGKEKTLSVRFKSLRFCVSIATAIFAIDRVLKILVEQYLSFDISKPIIEHFFYLTLVHNKGAAFGLWRGARAMLIISTLIVIVIVLVQLCRSKSEAMPRTQLLSWSFILGGAVGNLYDRVRFGYVIDYLDFRVWPVFNMADSAICVGVFWLIVSQLGERKK